MVGVALLWTESEDTSADSAKPSTQMVLVATETIEPGQRGEEIMADGLVRLEDWPGTIPSGALGSEAQLVGNVVTERIDSGSAIRSTQLRVATAREAAAVIVPEGSEGVAITLPFTAGGAGYVGAGDLVNLYAVVERDGDTQLVVVDTSVLVLDVSREVAPYVSGGPRNEGSALTFLLALRPAIAEQVVLLGAAGSFQLSLADSDMPRPQQLQSMEALFQAYRMNGAE